MMDYVAVLNTLPHNLMIKFRKLENLENKIINRKWSQIFNNICIKENLVPKYTFNIQLSEFIYKINKIQDNVLTC